MSLRPLKVQFKLLGGISNDISQRYIDMPIYCMQVGACLRQKNPLSRLETLETAGFPEQPLVS